MAERRRLPRLPRTLSSTDARENTSRADGASLAMGSTEYREHVADLQGMDEFEQEAQKLDQAGLRKAREFVPKRKDERTAAYDAKVADYADELREKLEDDGYGVLTTGERIVSHEVVKAKAAEQAMRHASAVAAQTETDEDDKFVKRRLPRALKEAVYDEGKDSEDIYPGMSTLEKYM